MRDEIVAKVYSEPLGSNLIFNFSWLERTQSCYFFRKEEQLRLNLKRKALSLKLDSYCYFQQEINIKHRFPLQITGNNEIIKVVLTLIQ